MKVKKVNGRRWYTPKSNVLKERVRLGILILTSPLWGPLYGLLLLADKIEDLLNFLDDMVEKFLDKVIPQIK